MRPAPPPQKPVRRRRPHGLVPSVVTFGVALLIVVMLFEYTNIFNDWLAWVIVPPVIALIAYDVYLRARGVGLED